MLGAAVAPAPNFLYAYVGNNPLNMTDPTGEWGLIGAAYGAVAGAVGGYVATGTLEGAAAGAVGGAVVGFVMPTASGAAGAALAVGTAGLASATGQLSGQAFENVSNGQPIAANLSVDGPATVLAAATGPAGGSLRAGASRTVAPIRGQVIGSQHGAQTLNRVPGNTIGAGLEGGLAGAAELVGDALGDGVEGIASDFNQNVPTNLRITDSQGNLDIGFATNNEVDAARNYDDENR